MKQFDGSPSRKAIKNNFQSLYGSAVSAICEGLENAIDYRNFSEIAGKVYVYLQYDKKRLVIADDGWGMDVDSLGSAMKIQQQDQQVGSSGAYGTGLKSMLDYICKQPLIISRYNGKIAWTRYAQEDNFDFIVYEEGDSNSAKILEIWDEYAVNPAGDGTIVVMNELNYSIPTIKEVEKKLQYKYHFKLQSTNVEIYLNGQKLLTKDPYAKTFSGTKGAKGCSIEGFEHIDKLHKTYRCPDTGVSVLMKHSISVGPSGAGDALARVCVVRTGVMVGTRQNYGLPRIASPQASMRRVQVLIEYEGTPEQIALGDKLLGVNHSKSISVDKKLDKSFLDFLIGIYGDALEYQLKQTEDGDPNHSFKDRAWKNLFTEAARKIKFSTKQLVQVEKTKQNKSEAPEPRADKEKGKGSHSRGKENKAVLDEWKGKFNADSRALGKTHPRYDYELHGTQITVIFNTDVASVGALLDETNSVNGYADKLPEAIRQLFFEAARQAVNRIEDKISQEEWNSYLNLHEKLSTDEEIMDEQDLRKAI